MFTLIGMGTGAAYLYSVAATMFPQMFPASFRGMGGEVAVYFEAAAVIITLVLLGQVLELRARQRTSKAIRELLHLAPQRAHLVLDGGRGHSLGPSQSGTCFGFARVNACLLTELPKGASALDESMVTGEPLPVEKLWRCSHGRHT